MERFKKLSKRNLMILADLLIIPGLLFCKWLSGYMLENGDICDWARVGAQCASCGGTRMVNSLLNGDIAAAFQFNPFLFCCGVYLAVSYILLNLLWVFQVEVTGRILKKMYSMATLWITLIAFLLFILVRNLSFIERLFQFLMDRHN